MKTATQYLTETLNSVKGRKTVLEIAKDLFKGDCNLAVSHLVGMLQTQARSQDTIACEPRGAATVQSLIAAQRQNCHSLILRLMCDR